MQFAINRRVGVIEYFRCRDRCCKARCKRDPTHGVTMGRIMHTCNREALERKHFNKKAIRDCVAPILEGKCSIPERVNLLVREVPQHRALGLPSQHSMTQSLRRQHTKHLGHLPSNQDFNVTPQAVMLPTGESMVLSDSYYDQKRMLILTSRCLATILCENSTVFCDGTFRVTPKPFKQVYTFHVITDNGPIFTAVALLPGKTKNMYVHLLREMKDQLCVKFDLQFRPHAFHCDFESAMVSAISSEFPHVSIKGCFFHFSAAIDKKLRNLQLSGLYLGNMIFRTLVRMLTATAFLPEEHVPNAVQGILDRIVTFHDRCPQFKAYFESYWMQKVTPKLWNVSMEQHRTNNISEGFNNKLSARFHRVPHQNIFRFFHVMKDLIADTELLFQRRASGSEPPYTLKKKDQKKNEKYQELQERHCNGEIPTMEMLFGVANAMSQYKRLKCCQNFEDVISAGYPPYAADVGVTNAVYEGTVETTLTLAENYDDPTSMAQSVNVVASQSHASSATTDLLGTSFTHFLQYECGHTPENLWDYFCSRNLVLTKKAKKDLRYTISRQARGLPLNYFNDGITSLLCLGGQCHFPASLADVQPFLDETQNQ